MRNIRSRRGRPRAHDHRAPQWHADGLTNYRTVTAGPEATRRTPRLVQRVGPDRIAFLSSGTLAARIRSKLRAPAAWTHGCCHHTPQATAACAPQLLTNEPVQTRCPVAAISRQAAGLPLTKQPARLCDAMLRVAAGSAESPGHAHWDAAQCAQVCLRLADVDEGKLPARCAEAVRTNGC